MMQSTLRGYYNVVQVSRLTAEGMKVGCRVGSPVGYGDGEADGSYRHPTQNRNTMSPSASVQDTSCCRHVY
jgi:hypothetical protein